MKTLTVVSQKGGVGKTTVALNVGFALARRGHRTLLVDTDPQGAVGLSLARAGDGPGLAGYVARQIPLDQAVVHTRITEFDLLPMGPIAFQDAHAFGSRLESGDELKRLFAESQKHYDLVLVDTPSGFGGITMGALRASEFCLSPLQAEPIALRSANQLLEVLAAIRGEGAQVRFAGFILTMLELRNADSLGVATDVWEKFPEKSVLHTTIPRDPMFLKASGAGVPLGLLSRRPPPVNAAFEQLAQELEARLELERDGKEDGPIALFA